jgi:hypothetical protein
MINETVFNGRDNSVWVGLRVNKALIDLTDVTKMQLIINSQTYDSDSLGEGENAVFDWTQGYGTLILRLGGLGISAGFYNVQLVVFSDDNPNGVLWDTMRIRFK